MIVIGFLLGAAMTAPVLVVLGLFAGRDGITYERAHIRNARRRSH